MTDQTQSGKLEEEEIKIDSFNILDYTYLSPMIVSKDDDIAVQQYIAVMEVHKEIMEGKCNAFEALATLTGFLLAFAFSDVIDINISEFESQLCGILYSMFLMITTVFGTWTLLVLSFIVIRLRRLLSRDCSTPLHSSFHSWRLLLFRESGGTAASYTQCWYYNRFFSKPNDKNRQHFEKYKNGIRPCRMICSTTISFLLMLIFYVSSIYVYVIDIYYQLSLEENSYLYFAIPIVWGLLLIGIFVFVINWLHTRGALTDLA